MKKLLYLLLFFPAIGNAYQHFTNPDTPQKVQGDLNDIFDQIRKDEKTIANFGGISVKNKGAKGDDVTDDRTAVQALFSSISAAGTAQTVIFPAGTYKFNEVLDIDPTTTSIQCYGATLDFSGINTSSTGIHFGVGTRSYFGQPYFNTQNSMRGCVVKGPGIGSTAVGILFQGASDPSGAHYALYDDVVYNWGYGIEVADNSYLTDFYHVNTFVDGICYYFPAASNSGERFLIHGGSLFNSSTGVYLLNGNADLHVDDMTNDAFTNTYFYQTGGGLFVTNSHLEGNYAPDRTGAQIYKIPSGGSSPPMVSFDNDWILVKSTHSAPVFEFGSPCYFWMEHCYINGTASVSNPIFQSDVAGGRFEAQKIYYTMNDTFFQNNGGIEYIVDQVGTDYVDFGMNVRALGTTVFTKSPPAGYAGFTSTANATNIAAATTGTYGNITSISSLPPGRFKAQACGVFSGTTVTETILAVSAFSGNTTTDQVSGVNQIETGVPANAFNVGGCVTWYVNKYATWTAYAKANFSYLGGAPTVSGSLSVEQLP